MGSGFFMGVSQNQGHPSGWIGAYIGVLLCWESTIYANDSCITQ